MTYISDKRKLERAFIPHQFEVELFFILYDTREWRDGLPEGIERDALTEGIEKIAQAHQMMKEERERYFSGDVKTTALGRAYTRFFSVPMCGNKAKKNTGGCLQISFHMARLLIERYEGTGVQCPVTDKVIDAWALIAPMLTEGENGAMLENMKKSNIKSANKILNTMMDEDYFSLPDRKAA